MKKVILSIVLLFGINVLVKSQSTFEFISQTKQNDTVKVVMLVVDTTRHSVKYINKDLKDTIINLRLNQNVYWMYGYRISNKYSYNSTHLDENKKLLAKSTIVWITIKAD